MFASQGVPDLGAFEVTPTAIAPQAIAIPALPVAGTTQRFLFGGDTIAKVTWDAFSSVPSYLTVRYYTGEIPPNSTNTQLAMRAYWDLDAPSGSYSYDLSLPYRDSLMGNLPVEADMKLSLFQTGWTNFLSSASTADTLNQQVNASYLSSFGLFAITDNLNPLPVKLTKITATYLDRSTSVNWTTSLEKNASHFEVERSLDGTNFSMVGTVKAKGNSSVLANYSFEDFTAAVAMEQNGVLYYRLRMVDLDSKFEYSQVLVVTNKTEKNTPIVLYPNPFTETITLNLNQAEASDIQFTLSNLSGMEIEKGKLNAPQGNSLLMLDNWKHLKSGIYFLQVELNDEIQTFKLIKQ